MRSKKTLLTLTSCFLFLVSFALQVSGQEQLKSCADVQSSKDFYSLGTKAGELNSEIRQAEKDLEQLQSKLTEAISEQQVTADKEEIKKIELQKSQSPADETRLRLLKLEVQNAVTVEDINQKIVNAKKELEDKRGLVRCIQTRLSTIFSPEQDFKLWMSLAFAFLIGLVIAGFFWLSNKDAIMRRAIFSGQTGIQFLTLFSIVIAIILFGITGILQDKELAALLGGISGYILGRYSSAGQAPAPSFLERLASVVIAPDKLSLSATSPSAQLTVSPRDKSGNEIKDDESVFKPKWESSNLAVATVDQSGLVKQVGTGNCTISASFNKISSNVCTVTST